MIEHILVGLDGSEFAETTLPYVRLLAKATGAKVTVVHVLEMVTGGPAWDDSGGFAALLRDTERAAEAYLKTIEEKLAAEGITTIGHLIHGDPRVELPRRAQQSGADLVVIATHGRTGLQHVMYGSVAESVAHRSNIPLLLINPLTMNANADPLVSRIVVPLDGSKLAEMALPLAADVASKLALPISLMRVAEPIYLPIALDDGPAAAFQDVYYDGLEKAAGMYLEIPAGDLRQRGIEVNTLVRRGNAASEIAADANQNPGALIVLATHGRTGVRDLLMGSVARQVVHLAASPVLLIPSVSPDSATASSNVC